MSQIEQGKAARPIGSGNSRISRWAVILILIALPTAAGYLTFSTLVQDGVDGVDGLRGVSSLAISADGSYLYAVGRNEDALAVFARDRNDGSLEFLEVHRHGIDGVFGLRFPSAVAVSPDGRHVYVVADVDDSLAVFNREPPNGRLTFAAAYQDGIDDISGLDGASGVAVTPNGRYVVVSGYNADSLVVFSRQATSDDLVMVDVEQNGLDGVELFGPTSVTVSPDSKHFYVPSEFDSAVSVFVQDPTRDGIEFAGVVLTDSMPRSVALDASGDNAYIAGGDWLRICRRNSETGWLMADWLFVDDLHGADGLEGSAAVIVSPRGHSVFAAGREEHAVAEFWRDPSDGYLELVDIQRDNEDGVDGLAYPTSFAMSRDARFLYVAGSGDDAIAIFDLPFEEFISGDDFESGDLGAWTSTTGGM